MIKQTIYCDRCGCKCMDSNPGSEYAPNAFTVVGNIHVANSGEQNGVGGGLIGCNKNLTAYSNNESMISHYCFHCLLKALDIKD